MNDRRSRFTLLAKLPRKCARALAQASVRMLRKLKRKVHTLTADNGREFASHKLIARELTAQFYFAHPLCSLGAWHQ